MDAFLRKKFVLLDTCFIAKAKNYSDTDCFNSFFATLKKYECTPLIHDLIRFEFFCGCKTMSHRYAKEAFLKLLSIGETLPVKAQDYTRATHLANVYHHSKIPPSGSGVTDCVNSAFLQKFANHLVLVTLDNSDYPLLCHERFYAEVIDTKKELITIGYYRFSETAFSQAYVAFEKSS
jgi:hypothetical protein